MTEHEIAVFPVEGGWSVECWLVGQPQMFLSGRKAEESAVRLAQTVARAGHPAEVRVHDRAQSLVGTRSYRAAG